MTDKEWCSQHNIPHNCLYYHIRRLRKKACEIPDNPVRFDQEHHEIIALDFSVPEPAAQPCVPGEEDGIRIVPAIRLSFSGISVEICNGAAAETIRDTLAALQKLC